MLEGLKALFTGKPQEDLAEWAAAGALIVDVRSPSEFASGHIPGSLNLPLDRLPTGLAKHRKDQAVILCCASGMRSGTAKRVLEAAGHAQVANGGSWQSLKRRLGK
jgi:phage shock protein E